MPWGRFDDTRLVAVTPAPEPQRALDLVDVTTGEPYTVPIPTTRTGTDGDAKLVLAPDGLGVATFGEPKEQVVATLTGLLGEPDSIEQADPIGGKFSYYRWGHLMVMFYDGPIVQGGGGTAIRGLVEYSLMREIDFTTQQVEPWEPRPWEEKLTTREGIGIGTRAAEADAAYPVTYSVSFNRDTCATIQENAGLGGPDEGGRILYVRRGDAEFGSAARGLYLSPVRDGEVWHIGANSRHPTYCFT